MSQRPAPSSEIFNRTDRAVPTVSSRHQVVYEATDAAHLNPIEAVWPMLMAVDHFSAFRLRREPTGTVEETYCVVELIANESLNGTRPTSSSAASAATSHGS